jgi:hypothetical protein
MKFYEWWKSEGFTIAALLFMAWITLFSDNIKIGAIICVISFFGIYFWRRKEINSRKNYRDIDEFLEWHKAEIPMLHVKRLINGKMCDCDLNDSSGSDIWRPIRRYAEIQDVEQVISCLKNRLRTSEAVTGWLNVILLAVIVLISCKWHYEYFWSISADSPAAIYSVPHIIKSDHYYYTWGKDNEGNTGWLHSNKDGKPDPNERALIDEEIPL